MKKMLMGFLLVILGVLAFYEPPTKQVDVVKVVTRGDTLWDIVGDAMERVGDKRYILEVMHETKRVNNLTSDKIGNLPIGAVIVVPCKVEI